MATFVEEKTFNVVFNIVEDPLGDGYKEAKANPSIKGNATLGLGFGFAGHTTQAQ